MEYVFLAYLRRKLIVIRDAITMTYAYDTLD